MGSNLNRIRPTALVLGLVATNLPAAAEVASPYQFYVGAWSCAGEFASNHQSISSNLRFTLDEKTGVLLKHHDDNPPNLFHAIELWAVDKEGTYHNTIADPFGGVRYFTSPGWSGDTFTWDSVTGAKQIERFTYTRIDSASMRVDWAVSKNGPTFSLGDTLTCKRV